MGINKIMDQWRTVRAGASSRKVAPARPQIRLGCERLKRGLPTMLTIRKVECWLQWIVPVSLDAQQEQVGFGFVRLQEKRTKS
ncbi:hypothetical protein R3I94_018113 [Phoxinus phoxinus]